MNTYVLTFKYENSSCNLICMRFQYVRDFCNGKRIGRSHWEYRKFLVCPVYAKFLSMNCWQSFEKLFPNRDRYTSRKCIEYNTNTVRNSLFLIKTTKSFKNTLNRVKYCWQKWRMSQRQKRPQPMSLYENVKLCQAGLGKIAIQKVQTNYSMFYFK